MALAISAINRYKKFMEKKDEIIFAVPAEDVEYVESLRIYNVKIKKYQILDKITFKDYYDQRR